MSSPVAIALTMGDVCGIGPELLARCIGNQVDGNWIPLVIGDPVILKRACRLIGSELPVHSVTEPNRSLLSRDTITCWNPHGEDLRGCRPGSIDARAGQAAFDWLRGAIRLAREGIVDAIVTAPLNKESLAAAGVTQPGHTEILADECGVQDHAMMLYLAPETGLVKSPRGLGIAHVTLHVPLLDVPRLINFDSIKATIRLVADFMQQMGVDRPRIGICAINPHAGESGLFGDEEREIIGPAVAQAQSQFSADIVGPRPADTLMKSAVEGNYDGIVAMYHDQGHIALKLIGFDEAVNVTLGLPIVRTSPSQGTAFDIAWQGIARPSGIHAAITTAIQLVGFRQRRD